MPGVRAAALLPRPAGLPLQSEPVPALWVWGSTALPEPEPELELEPRGATALVEPELVLAQAQQVWGATALVAQGC